MHVPFNGEIRSCPKCASLIDHHVFEDRGEASESDELPEGIEKSTTPKGRTFYIRRYFGDDRQIVVYGPHFSAWERDGAHTPASDGFAVVEIDMRRSGLGGWTGTPMILGCWAGTFRYDPEETGDRVAWLFSGNDSTSPFAMQEMRASSLGEAIDRFADLVHM